MPKLRAAIVGTGLIATKKHVPAFSKLKNKVELVGVCDKNLDAAQKLAHHLGIAAYGELSDLLSNETPELVDICTPPQTHAKLAVEAMKAGCHVFIEKPMALTLAECDEIINASEKSRVKVCVGHSDLFYHPFIKARQLVANGEIGEFRGMRIFLSTPTDYMTSQKDHWAHRLAGGVIGETGPHVVYMSLAFINPIRKVSIDAIKLLDYPWSRFEDYRIDLLGDRGISSITLSYATDHWMARLDILGSKGILMLDLESMSLVKYRRLDLKPVSVGLSQLSECGQLLRNALANGLRFATAGLSSTHDRLIGGFVESIVNKVQPPVTVQEGREAVRVMSMIVERLEEQRR